MRYHHPNYHRDPIGTLRAENERLRATLAECEDYFDGRADVVDGSYGVPAPNREMTLLTEIREALGKGGY